MITYVIEEIRQRIIVPLDKVIDRCIEHWGLVSILSLGGTFLFLFLFLIYGAPKSTVYVSASALGAIELLIGIAIFLLDVRYRRQLRQWAEAADAIEATIHNDDVFGDWDAFVERPSRDRELEEIRVHCLEIPKEYPPRTAEAYCNDDGVQVLEAYVRRLRSGLLSRAMDEFFSRRKARKGEKKAAGAEHLSEPDVEDDDMLQDTIWIEAPPDVADDTPAPDPEPEPEPKAKAKVKAKKKTPATPKKTAAKKKTSKKTGTTKKSRVA